MAEGAPIERERPSITPEEFGRRVNRYTPPVQETIATLSSTLLEPDAADNVRNDDGTRRFLVTRLQEDGLPPAEVGFVFRYFGLKVPPKESQAHEK